MLASVIKKSKQIILGGKSYDTVFHFSVLKYQKSGNTHNPKLLGKSRFLVTSTFPTVYPSAAISSTIGACRIHGPHQVAQKSHQNRLF